MNLAPVTISGNLTGDPELTFTASGQARCAFSVAVNHVWYDQSNEKQEKTSYFNVVAWRFAGEHAARTLEKGLPVIVVGRLEQRSYDDKDGVKRSITEVIADTVAVDTKGLESIVRRTKQAGDAPAPNRAGNSAQTPRRTKPMTAAPVGGGMMDAEEPF
jgi:single-strand DNA-binding protein